QEIGDVPHRSTMPGVAHLCGHDGHMAMLMGVAPNPVPKDRIFSRFTLLQLSSVFWEQNLK
ncbi:MAG: hypothetical protein ACQES9_00925, partial [Myxococcota bacterium]